MNTIDSHQAVAHHTQQRGSAMLYVTGLVVVISIMVAGSLEWHRNMGSTTLNIMATEQAEAEHLNVSRIIHSHARAQLLTNNPSILNGLHTHLDDNLTRSPRDSARFFLSSPEAFTNAVPGWMSTDNYATDPRPVPSNPLFQYTAVIHEFDFDYVLRLLPDGSNTNSYDFSSSGSTSMHIREIPTCQIPFTAVDTFNATNMPFMVYVNGPALFPYKVNTGTPAKGYALQVQHAILPEKWTNPGSLSASRVRTSTGLAASWMLDPYDLVEENSSGNFASQKYYGDAQVINFDGQTITHTGGLPVGTGVEEVNGMKRLVFDLKNMTGKYNFYVDCNTPLARQRGIVLRGDTSGSEPSNHQADAILTNGSITFEGEQKNTELITGSSYGGLVFTDPSRSEVTWRTYIVAPVLPENIFASSDTTTNPDASDISGLINDDNSFYNDQIGTSYDTITIKAKWNSGNDELQIGYSFDGSPANHTTWLHLDANSDIATLHAINTSNSTNTIVESNSWPITNTDDIEFTYHRSLNAVSYKVGANSVAHRKLDMQAPRFETTYSKWNGSAEYSSMDISVRKEGTSFYKNGAVSRVVINGAVLVGKNIGGNLESLTINPAPASLDMLTLSDRILLMDPP